MNAIIIDQRFKQQAVERQPGRLAPVTDALVLHLRALYTSVTTGQQRHISPTSLSTRTRLISGPRRRLIVPLPHCH